MGALGVVGETGERRDLFPPQFLFIAHLVALWPVGIWYVARLRDGSDEPWGLLALATAVLFLYTAGRPRRVSPRSLRVCIVFVTLYVCSLFFAPPLIRAILGVLSLATLGSSVYLGRSGHLGVSALCVLSLPIIASLQFFGGYPIRLLTAECATFLLRGVGYAVANEGTTLRYLGEMVVVDAPCSGIKMLWSGLYVQFSLASFLRLSPLVTWLTYLSTMLMIFSANVARATILFFGESGIVHFPPWAHQGIGLVLFGLLSLAIFYVQTSVRRLSRGA